MGQQVGITKEDGLRVVAITSLEAQLATKEGQELLSKRIKLSNDTRDVDNYGNNIIQLTIQGSEQDMENIYLIEQVVKAWQRKERIEHYKWNNLTEPVSINFGFMPSATKSKPKSRFTHQRILTLMLKIIS